MEEQPRITSMARTGSRESHRHSQIVITSQGNTKEIRLKDSNTNLVAMKDPDFLESRRSQII